MLSPHEPRPAQEHKGRAGRAEREHRQTGVGELPRWLGVAVVVLLPWFDSTR